mmetsp:Transcript_32201/g.70786  ORF Transcript_32201/g.70786 Transcript_32201/m.70786 type:complete len:80 (+) Transcript_32201:661-900(+)
MVAGEESEESGGKCGIDFDDMRQELVVETNVREAASDDELIVEEKIRICEDIDEKVSVPRCFSSSLEDVEEVPFCIEKS